MAMLLERKAWNAFKTCSRVALGSLMAHPALAGDH
jgi:hypothetical protein